MDDAAAGRPIYDPRVHHVAPRLLALLAVATLAACGGAAPATTQPSSATTPAAPVPTQAATAAPPAPSAGPGVDVGSLLGGAVGVPAGTTWIRVSDQGAPFTFEVPATWTDHASGSWDESGATIGVVLAAGPATSKLGTDFSVPGIAIGLAADAGGRTPRQVVERDNAYGGACTPGPVQDASQAAATTAYQLWACGASGGLLLVMAIASPGDPGLIEIVFQGTSEADLGYLQHIIGSLAGAAPQATTAPAASGGSVSGPTYTISMSICQNQHGQGVAEGLIRNDTALVHTYRIVVAFSDPNGVFLNDTAWTTSDLQPGVTARWQAVVPSGLPAVSVSCQITAVELVR